MKTNQNQFDEVIKLFEQGFGERKIAKILNITRGLVQGVFRKINVYGTGKRSQDKLYKEKVINKICKDCLISLPIDNFRVHKQNSNHSAWIASKCFDCEKIYSKKLNSKNEYVLKRKIYRKNNKHKLNEYDRLKRKNNIFYRLRCIMSCNINRYLKLNNSSKGGKSYIKYISYTSKELKEHLESLFEPWMSWDNQGIYNKKRWDDNDSSTWTWQIDHIIPHSTFNYKSMEEQEFKDCWALNNLRPYSAKQNVIDGGNKIRHNIIY